MFSCVTFMYVQQVVHARCKEPEEEERGTGNRVRVHTCQLAISVHAGIQFFIALVRNTSCHVTSRRIVSHLRLCVPAPAAAAAIAAQSTKPHWRAGYGWLLARLIDGQTKDLMARFARQLQHTLHDIRPSIRDSRLIATREQRKRNSVAASDLARLHHNYPPVCTP